MNSSYAQRIIAALKQNNMWEGKAYLRTLSDADLVVHLRNGDHEAMDIITERHCPVLLPFITKVVGNETDAGDVLQDTLMLAFLKIQNGSYQEQGHFETWLRTIAFRKAIDFKVNRDGRARKKLDAKQCYINELKSRELPPVNREKLLRAISTLSPQQQQICNLHVLDGIPLNEVAVILNITPKLASTAYSKARVKLKEYLKNGK